MLRIRTILCISLFLTELDKEIERLKEAAHG